MNKCFHLPTSRESAETVSTVIEIPTGTGKKYKLCSSRTFFRLGSSLNSSIRYPGDILALGAVPALPDRVFHPRPLGMFAMLEQDSYDQKDLGIYHWKSAPSRIKSYEDIQAHIPVFLAPLSIAEGQTLAEIAGTSSDTPH